MFVRLIARGTPNALYTGMNANDQTAAQTIGRTILAQVIPLRPVSGTIAPSEPVCEAAESYD